MSDGNPPSFFWSLERFWEGLAVLTFLLSILVYLIAPNFGLVQSDGTYILTISIVSVLQAIYFDRKMQEAEVRHP